MTNILAHDVTLIILVHTVVYFQELAWGMFLCALKRKRCPHFCNLWLLIVKVTLRDISCNFWIMVLISIVSSMSLNSNELDNNFNLHKNCLMPMSSLFISKKDYLAIGWLLIITFYVVRSRKCEFQVYYLKKNQIFLWQSDTCHFLNKRWTRLERSVKEVSIQITISEFRNTGREKLIFSRFTQKQLQIHNETKVD